MELDQNGSQRLQTIMKKVKEILEKNHNVHIIMETDFKKENYQCKFCFQVARAQNLS
jgi:Holliday junction resolvasome RuvABC endonuclease subunit